MGPRKPPLALARDPGRRPVERLVHQRRRFKYMPSECLSLETDVSGSRSRCLTNKILPGLLAYRRSDERHARAKALAGTWERRRASLADLRPSPINSSDSAPPRDRGRRRVAASGSCNYRLNGGFFCVGLEPETKESCVRKRTTAAASGRSCVPSLTRRKGMCHAISSLLLS